MAKGDLTTPPPTVTPKKQVVVNTKSENQKKGNLSLAPMVARGMTPMAAAKAVDGKAKTVNSPPQNLQEPLKALFGDRMKSRKPK
jgi:hypothetical protein